MALLTAGYWPTTFWSDDYWQEDYWQDYGVTTGGSPLTAGYWQPSYWTSGYWQEDYWQDYGFVGPSGNINASRNWLWIIFKEEGWL